MIRYLCCCTLLTIGWAYADTCRAQAPFGTPAAAGQAETDLNKLVGAVVDIKLSTGMSQGSVEVVKVIAGTTPGSIRSLTVKPTDSPRQTIIAAQNVVEILAAGVPLDVVYNKQTRELLHNAEKRTARLAHDAKVQEQLRARRARLWEEVSDADMAKYVEEEKEFLKKAQQTMGIPMQLLETKYYLFFTDMPLDSVGIYVQYLDKMYENMTKAFDFPEGKNIWRGKCPVIAFQNQPDYVRFESQVMNYNGAQGSQGLCHNLNNGRVVMACYKGSSVGFFATVLVHETSHGFLHRYKSTVHVPAWINEGIADWVAGTVVGQLDDEVRDRQFDAVQLIRTTGSLGGNFFDDSTRFDRVQYGIASSMVEILLRIDPKKYRKLIDGVKEGLSSEEALREAYGVGFAELTLHYGKLAQVPNLRQ